MNIPDSAIFDLKAVSELLERTIQHGTLDPKSRRDLRAAYGRVNELIAVAREGCE